MHTAASNPTTDASRTLADHIGVPRYGVRMVREAVADTGPCRIRSAQDVHEFCAPFLADLPHEELHVLYLSTKNEILGSMLVTRGTLDASLVHPREVFRGAILLPCANIIVVHNHPTGDPTPSTEDRTVTRQLCAAGRTLGIDVLDHVIVGNGDRYVSLAESGLLD